MVDPATTKLWALRGLYLLLAGVLIFLNLIPLQTTPIQIPPPDYLLCLTAVWVVRHPEHIPAVAVAGVFLLADLMFMQPPGLMAALVVLGMEFLRSRHQYMREFPFVLEWAVVGVVFTAITFGCRMVSALLVLAPPPLGPSVLQLGATLLCYPLVAFVSYLITGGETGPISPRGARGRTP